MQTAQCYPVHSDLCTQARLCFFSAVNNGADKFGVCAANLFNLPSFSFTQDRTTRSAAALGYKTPLESRRRPAENLANPLENEIPRPSPD